MKEVTADALPPRALSFSKLAALALAFIALFELNQMVQASTRVVRGLLQQARALASLAPRLQALAGTLTGCAHRPNCRMAATRAFCRHLSPAAAPPAATAARPPTAQPTAAAGGRTASDTRPRSWRWRSGGGTPGPTAAPRAWPCAWRSRVRVKGAGRACRQQLGTATRLGACCKLHAQYHTDCALLLAPHL